MLFSNEETLSKATHYQYDTAELIKAVGELQVLTQHQWIFTCKSFKSVLTLAEYPKPVTCSSCLTLILMKKKELCIIWLLVKSFSFLCVYPGHPEISAMDFCLLSSTNLHFKPYSKGDSSGCSHKLQ